MALSSYSTIKTAIGDWLGRSDLGDPIDDMIDIAEARIYGELRLSFMESALSVTISSGVATIPSDFLELKHAYIDGTPTQWLDVKAAQWIHQMYPTRSSDSKPTFIAVDDGNFIFGPYPDSGYTLKGTYYAKPTALSTSNETNWVVTNAPDLVLFGALVESAPYLGDDPRITLWEAKFQQTVDRVKRQEKRERWPMGSALAVTTG